MNSGSRSSLRLDVWKTLVVMLLVASLLQGALLWNLYQQEKDDFNFASVQNMNLSKEVQELKIKVNPSADN